MKKYSSFFGSLLIIATFIVSCDYVNNAIPPSTAASGTTPYYVSQILGTCESPRKLINVIVNSYEPR